MDMLHSVAVGIALGAILATLVIALFASRKAFWSLMYARALRALRRDSLRDS